MKVSVTSDGTGRGTSVTGPDGTPVEGVTALNWRIALGEPSRFDIELTFVPLDRVEGEADMIGPNGKSVRRIEYADGSVQEYPASTGPDA